MQTSLIVIGEIGVLVFVVKGNHKHPAERDAGNNLVKGWAVGDRLQV